MDDFRVHIGDLFLHFADFLLSGADVSLESFYFVIQHKLEFLELLGFFLQLIDSGHFVSDGLLSFFVLFGLGLFFL